MLRAGGQARFAERVLADALRRAPADPLLRQVDASFRNDPLPVARGALLEPSHRFAPWPVAAPPGQPLPGPGARFIGGAVLIGDGSLAVAPLAAIAALPDTRGRRLWLRNGLGQTAAASLASAADESLAASGIALLRLDAPLLHASPVSESAREPFAGSPGYVLRFATTADSAWPWLSQGFLGSSFDDGSAHGRRRLGFDIVGGGNPAGAPVLDAAGRLAGMVVGTAPDGGSVWAPVSAWQRGAAAVLPENAHMPVRASELARDLPRQAIGPSPPGLTASVPTHRALVAPDAIYEAGLPIALQLLAEDR